jgi:hypothetical protein
MQELGTKVSELDSAGALAPADQLYIIQSGVSRRVTLSDLLASLPNTLVRFKGLIALDPQIQTIANTGVINATTLITAYTSDNAVTNLLSIDDGTVFGQLKVFLNLGGSGSPTIDGSNLPYTVSVNDRGSVILMWVGGSWQGLAGFSAGYNIG